MVIATNAVVLLLLKSWVTAVGSEFRQTYIQADVGIGFHSRMHKAAHMNSVMTALAADHCYCRLLK